SMNITCFRTLVVALCFTPAAFPAEAKVDLHNGIPANAYLALYSQRNPDRDQLHQYYQEVWQTIHDEQLPERVFSFMVEAMPNNSMDQVQSVRDELRTAFSDVDWNAMAECKEIAYGQVMDVPQTHHLLLIRLASDRVAEKFETALIETADIIESRSNK